MMQPRTQEIPSMTGQRNQRHKPHVTANSLVKSCRRRYRAVMCKAKAAECFGNCRAGMEAVVGKVSAEGVVAEGVQTSQNPETPTRDRETPVVRKMDIAIVMRNSLPVSAPPQPSAMCRCSPVCQIQERTMVHLRSATSSISARWEKVGRLFPSASSSEPRKVAAVEAVRHRPNRVSGR